MLRVKGSGWSLAPAACDGTPAMASAPWSGGWPPRALAWPPGHPRRRTPGTRKGCMVSSISGPNAHKNTMLPMMCDQPPCINMAVRSVFQPWPALMSAGVTDHRVTNASPPISSRTNTKTLIRMMSIVTMGVRVGRRDASESGIMPAMLLSFSLSRSARPSYGATEHGALLGALVFDLVRRLPQCTSRRAPQLRL